MSTKKNSSSVARVEAYRARLRAQGLRPLQIWVPDVRTKQFLRQAHLQSLAVAKSNYAHDDQSFIESITDHSE